MRPLLCAALLLYACGGDDAAGGAPDATVTPDARATPDAAPPDASTPEPPGLEGITNAHNVIRAALGIPPLTWNPQLAASAQAWASMCIDMNAPTGFLDPNPNRGMGFPWPVGESIASSSGAIDGQQAVNLWNSEKQFYDYASNTCMAMHICSHYTQIVWAATTDLGCGIATCPNLTFSGNVVCDYGPAGNTGGKPY
jgi:pathogenesis-related protein 1